MVKNPQSGIVPCSQPTRCKMYFGAHDENRCKSRGPEWIPDWIKQSAAKCDAQYPTDIPDPLYIKADPPLHCSSQTGTSLHTHNENSGITFNMVNEEEKEMVYSPENIKQLSSFIRSTDYHETDLTNL